MRPAGRLGQPARWMGLSGALGIVLLLTASPAAAGEVQPAAFAHATWYPSNGKSAGGCASAVAYSPHWSARTGAGSMKGAVSAKTCPAYRGGPASDSYASSYANLDIYAPVRMHTGVGGINVSWNLQMTVTHTVVVTTSKNLSCPLTTYHYNYWYGYTWYNYTYTSGFCEFSSDMDISGGAYLLDRTTGAYTYSSGPSFYGVNDTFIYNDTFGYSYNYSNASYWSSNYSYGPYSYTYNYSYAYGSLATGTYAPTYFLNGTFLYADHYEVVTYLSIGQSVAFDFGGAITGHAGSSIFLGGGKNHADLMPFVIW